MKLAPGWRVMAVLLVVACAPTGSGGAPASGALVALPDESPASTWQRVLEAARREGTVSVFGPAAPQNREALTMPFERKYPDIRVEYQSGPPAQLPPKLLAERAAGFYSADLVIAGTTTLLSSLKPADVLDAIQPYLVGPETQDLTVWRGGKLSYADDAGQHALVFGAYVKGPFIFNTAQVSAGEIRSWRDLTHPRWKGKMAMYDPRLAGSGNSIATHWYTLPTLGKDYIKEMIGQDLVISRDERQILDWVARGQYLIGIGVGEQQATDFMRRGLPLRLLEASALVEPPYVTSGTGAVSVVNRPPHPNALRVYLDFLLSREGQLEWSMAAGVPSLRLDVPRDHVEAALVPRPDVEYKEQHTEPFLAIRDEVEEYLKSVLP